MPEITTTSPDDLIEMAHPDLPGAAPVPVTHRQLVTVWEPRGWRATGAPVEETPTPAAPETTASRRKSPAATAAPTAAEAASEEI
ncbi:hypothetical protein [Streptomyces sp. NPDC091212]|uniref:hypothetical protein n=1 Tax=Streptomyces sp. NPDC091212 TaxID=3155191 RepID=UPI00343E75FE